MALLAHRLELGRIHRIHRGLFATIPPGVPADDFSVDLYLLAGKITDDAILGNQSSLEAHGRAYSIFRRFTYLTKRNLGRSFQFQGVTYQGVSHPKALRHAGQEELYVEELDRAGLDIRVTNLERSFVDVRLIGRISLGAGMGSGGRLKASNSSTWIWSLTP